jgi:hypothetical protein
MPCIKVLDVQAAKMDYAYGVGAYSRCSTVVIYDNPHFFDNALIRLFGVFRVVLVFGPSWNLQRFLQAAANTAIRVLAFIIP